MGDLDGVADAIRKLSGKIDGIGRPQLRLPKWFWPVQTLSLIAIGAGCATFVDYRLDGKASSAEVAELRRLLEASILAREAAEKELRRIIAMQREDPKAFPRIDAQFKAIEDYERTRTVDGGSNNRSR